MNDRVATGRGSPPPAWLEWAALLVIYLVWGSTYLAIRVVVQALPPLASAGVRFLLAGTIVALAIGLRSGLGRLRVSRAELAGAAVVGVLLLLGGNGLVSVGELVVPSALTALIIASTPLWVVLFRRMTRQKVPAGTLLGVAVGFGGVALLVVPTGLSGAVVPLGLLTIVVAAFCWASGSFLSQRLRLPRDPFVLTAHEMLLGGAALLAAGLLTGERFDPAAAAAHPGSLVALAYLVVFGSLVAFTAYTWLLQVAPISRVATYAYVNPVVAVALGWLILGEEISLPMLVGGAIIVLGVALVVRQEPARRRPASLPTPLAAADVTERAAPGA